MSNGPYGSPPEEPGHFQLRVPTGDDRPRLVCQECGWINYVNPKVIVGAVVTAGEHLLICRRAIEPRRGYWTIPAGFMEQNETAEEGAAREAREEANAHIAINALLGVYSIPRISQVQLIFRAELADPNVSPGPESLDVELITWDQIPWTELAFPSVRWALQHFDATRHQTHFPPFGTPADDLT